MSQHEQPNARSSKHPSRGRRYAPAEKAEILKDSAELGVASSAEKHRCSRWTVYAWLSKQKRDAAAEVQASSESTGGASVEPEPVLSATQDERHGLILELWRQQPGLGPSQIRGLLKRKGFKASVNTVPLDCTRRCPWGKTSCHVTSAAGTSRDVASPSVRSSRTGASVRSSSTKPNDETDDR